MSVKRYIEANWLGMIGFVFLLASPVLFAAGAAERGWNAALVAFSLLLIVWLDKKRRAKR
jgi:hypothetical protein